MASVVGSSSSSPPSGDTSDEAAGTTDPDSESGKSFALVEATIPGIRPLGSQRGAREWTPFSGIQLQGALARARRGNVEAEDDIDDEVLVIYGAPIFTNSVEELERDDKSKRVIARRSHSQALSAQRSGSSSPKRTGGSGSSSEGSMMYLYNSSTRTNSPTWSTISPGSRSPSIIGSGISSQPSSPTLDPLWPSGAGAEGNSLYKTEMCRPYQETNQCKYGHKCQFAHGIRELRQIPRHPKYKTEVCRSFTTSGTCPYGTRCRFIHPTIGLEAENGSANSDDFEVVDSEGLALKIGEEAGPSHMERRRILRRLPVFETISGIEHNGQRFQDAILPSPPGEVAAYGIVRVPYQLNQWTSIRRL